jgi:TM2 domain-containing membrane protein YozV
MQPQQQPALNQQYYVPQQPIYVPQQMNQQQYGYQFPPQQYPTVPVQQAPMVYHQPMELNPQPTQPIVLSEVVGNSDSLEHVEEEVPANYWISSTDSRMTDNSLAVLLANLFILPGIGHMLFGQTQKGVAYIIGSIIGGIIMVVLYLVLIGIFFLPCALVWNIAIALDGYWMCERLNRGVDIGQGECASSIAAMGLSSAIKGPVFVNHDLQSNERAKLH